MADAMTDELIDLLLELQHDLGKYLRLPLTMLPADADDGALRAALTRALQETRKGPSGVRPARAIWQGFRAELGEALAGDPGLRALEDAVQRALDWEARLEDLDAAGAPIDRARALSELSAVSEAIGALLDSVQARAAVS